MRIFLFLFLAGFGQLSLLAQQPATITLNGNDSISIITVPVPEFPGGEEAMVQFISENIDYPKAAIENDISGRVVVGFFITETGNMDSIHIVSSPDSVLSKEAIRVIRMMPAWKPAMMKDKPIRVRFQIPIDFQMDNGSQRKRRR